MMKKYRILAIAIILIGITSAAIWSLQVGQDSPSVEASKPASSDTPTPAQQEQMRKALAELETSKKQSDDAGILKATQKLAEAIGGKAGAMLNMAAGRIVPVRFYGRVIDQNGAGVAGARVNMVIGGGGSLAPGTGLTYFETDAEGYFEVKAKGQGVSILSVEHSQVADVFFRNHHDGRKAIAAHLEATDRWGAQSNWHSYERREKPFEIRAWRVTKFEKIISKSGAYHIPVNGEDVLFNQSLKISCKRNEMSDYEDYGDWSITMSPVEGGIQETDALYLNEAPQGGYVPAITVSKRKSDPDYTHRIYPARHYYYRAKNGSIYGSLEIDFQPFSKKDNCILMTKMKLNPSGSRNLAVRSRQ
ncbi:MAG: carboxypeptidase-like regulatory domain-containing protein [Candidatus Thiodiazotropha endolucinida]